MSNLICRLPLNPYQLSEKKRHRLSPLWDHNRKVGANSLMEPEYDT